MYKLYFWEYTENPSKISFPSSISPSTNLTRKSSKYIEYHSINMAVLKAMEATVMALKKFAKYSMKWYKHDAAAF